MKGPLNLLSCLFFLVLSLNFSFGQTASVKFEVRIPSEGFPKDSSIFIAGSFNCWNPHDSLYIMQKTDDNLYSLVVPVFDGKKYEYKYTQGDWGSVETSSDSAEIKNRQMISHDGVTITDTVQKWKSPQTSKPKDTTFMFSKKQLNELSKLKEEMGKKMESRIKNITGDLKKIFENMLSDKPSIKLRNKYHNKAVSDITYVLKTVADVMWKVSSMMAPEQKKALLTEMNNPKAQGDILGLMMKALNPQ